MWTKQYFVNVKVVCTSYHSTTISGSGDGDVSTGRLIAPAARRLCCTLPHTHRSTALPLHRRTLHGPTITHSTLHQSTVTGSLFACPLTREQITIVPYKIIPRFESTFNMNDSTFYLGNCIWKMEIEFGWRLYHRNILIQRLTFATV